MRFLRLSSILMTLLVAACGGDDAPATPDAERPDAAPDAMPGAFACLDEPLPTVAADPLVITGVTSEVTASGSATIAGVEVQGFRNGTATAIASGTSDAEGVYSASVVTGGTPLDGYIVGHRPGMKDYRDVYLYPPSPIAAATADAPLLFIADNTFNFIQTLTSVNQAPGNGWIGVLVVDCFNAPVTGATVTTDPGYVVKYNVDGLPNPDATTTADDGLAYVFNVTPGEVTVEASYAGMTLLAHAIEVRADVLTTTAVAPGPQTLAE